MASLYVHIPFCKKKCGYCSFTSYAGLDGLQEAYLNALEIELEGIASQGPAPLGSVFFGGGTPTWLGGNRLARLVEKCLLLLPVEAGAEISVEGNPGTVDRSSLTALLAAGVNRLSLGIQSLDQAELNLLGRGHSCREALDAYGLARAAGFKNISLDLMSGLPGQTGVSWQKSLTGALSCGPEHLSIYQLSFEEGTPLYRNWQAKELKALDEKTIARLDNLTDRAVAKGGYEQYEISNYAKPGYRCRHNLRYWQNADYFAAGAGAVSYGKGARETRIRDVRAYIRAIERGENAIVDREALSLKASFRETVVLGLRMVQGISIADLNSRYGLDPLIYYGPTLSKLLALEVIAINKGFLQLTKRGRMVANRVMAELV